MLEEKIEKKLYELVGEFHKVVPSFSRIFSRKEIISGRAEDHQMCLRGYWTRDGAVYGCDMDSALFGFCYGRNDYSGQLGNGDESNSESNVNNLMLIKSEHDKKYQLPFRPYLILSENTNSLLSHPLEARDLFRKNEELFLSEEEQKVVEEDVTSGKAIKIYLANLDHPEGLRAKVSKDGNRYLQISADRLRYFYREKDYFNEEQKKLLQAVYGEPELQGRIMEESGVPFTQIHFLSSHNVVSRTEVYDSGEKMFVRASWIDRFHHFFAVSLKGNDLDAEVRMRGELKHQPELQLVYTNNQARRMSTGGN